MGVRIIGLGGEPGDNVCLYCSTTMWAFGPVFEDAEAAEAFLEWMQPNDPRIYSEQELRAKYHTWLEEYKPTS